jgi:glucosamine 6-phosphate synthetase-like amidotransferase/phosphosugar isomerase protein
MCGIAGFSLSTAETVDAAHLSRILLLRSEERGNHATGAAFFEDAAPYVQKADMPAREFIDHLDMNANVTTAILHTRWATKGSVRNNANNHPIDVNGIMGVHNGVVRNDDALFDEIGAHKRIAQVDSEAIFASLLHSQEKAVETLSRVQGSAAVAWLESFGDPDMLHLARLSISPLIYAFTEAGSLIFASTDETVRAALAGTGMILAGGPHRLEEGRYLRVRNGEIVSRMAFEPAARSGVLSQVERRALNLT